MKKLPEHVIASSEAAESSSNVKDPEEEKHDGVLLFEGSPDGSDEVDTKLFRPLGYWAYVKPELYDVKHDRAFVWRTCALRMGRYNDVECS